MNNKYISAILLLLSFIAPFAASADRFYLNASELELGKTETLQFVLENSQNYYGFQAEVKLPAGLEAVKGNNGEIEVSLSSRADNGEFHINSNVLEDGSLIMGAFSAIHHAFSGNNGTLVNLKVSVAESFSGGTVTISNVKFINSQDKDVEFDSTSATFGVLATGILLSESSYKLTVGSTFTLTATVVPEAATNKTVTWSSDKENVAKVDATGKITAISPGEATITATCGTLTATCKVSVADKVIEVSGITLNKTEVNLTEGETATLSATVAPSDATDKTVIWTSSDASVVSVSAEGVVTAAKPGTATITAKSSNGKTATCKVTVSAKPVEVIEVTGVALSKTELSLTEGETATLTATITPDNATDKTVTWTSSDASVVSVSAEGVVTAVKPGTATITAKSSNGKTATCKVTVSAKPVEAIEVNGVSLSKTELSLTEGETATLTATIVPDNATDKTVTWTSSDASVVSVSAEGVVTAVKPGTATVTAKSSNGKTATCKVTVSAKPVEAIEVTGVSLSKTELSLTEGETATLTATIVPDNATDKTVTWTSSDASVVSVSAEGVITAIKAGTATITAKSSNGKTAICNVTVLSILIESLTIDPTEWSGIEGSEFTIKATVLPENAANKALLFESSDTTVATVDEKGNVKVLKEGSCVITVSTVDGSDLKAECVIASISGVESIFTNPDAEVDVYDMNGVLLKKGCSREGIKLLKPAVYILRSGGNVVKALVK